MNLARTQNTADIIITTILNVTVPYRLLPKRLLGREQLLELVGFQGAELVAFADDIAAVRV